MFAKLSLGITGFIYLAMSYYYMFDMEGLFTALGILYRLCVEMSLKA